MNDVKNQPAKSKSLRKSRPLDIDFVVPIQLEECVHQVKTNHADVRIRTRIRPTEDSDRVGFVVDADLSREKILFGKGIMQRWQGTSTRVRGRIRIKSQWYAGDGERMRQISSVALAIIVPAGYGFLYFMANRHWSIPQIAVLLLAYALLLVTGVFARNAWIRYRQRRAFTRQFVNVLMGGG